ncbi:MAG: biopolymer transporter ExbD, partial [Planctomycetota bacterium]
VFLPIDPRTPGTEPPTVRLRLDRPRGADKTRVLVDDAETGRGYMGFAMAEDRLAKRLAADPGLEVLIDGREKVPYGEVMKALRLVRKVGIERVNFDWGPPPGEQMLEEPEEVVIPESRELAERMGCLPLVQRGKIRVWPAAEPAERRALRLPDLPGDTPLSTKAHQEEELFELLVDRKGLFRIGGKHADMKELLKQLLIRAETRRDEDHPKKISHAAILIHAPREVRWREIQWAMLAAASPDVRIYRLYFATRAPDGSFAYVPVFLPAEYAVPADPRILRLELKRKRTETVTRLSLLGDACGEGESGFETLRKKLPELRKERPERSIGELYGWASVPYQDAVRGIAAFHAAGVTRIQFVGPPPRSRRK